MDHHQQLGQFSILCCHSSRSRCPLERVFAASPAVNGTRATHLPRQSFKARVSRLDSELRGKAEEQRRGACELSEGCGGPDNARKLGQQEGRRRRYGSPAVSMATAVLTQLLPPHLWQTQSNNEAAFDTVSSKTLWSATYSLSPAKKRFAWRRLPDRQREGAENLSASTVLWSGPGVPKHSPSPKTALAFGQ